MSVILRNQGWLRTYIVDGKELNNIAYYDHTGIIVQTNRGWLERHKPDELQKSDSQTEDAAYIVLEKEPIRKIKPDFSKLYVDHQPFYVKTRGVGRSRFDQTRYTLFLPYIPEDWTVTRFYRDVATQRNWYDCYLHKKEGFLIDKYLTCEPIKEDVKFVKKISELARALGVSDVNEFTVLKNRDKIIELIKKFPTGG